MGYTILQLGGPVGRLYVEESFDEGAKDTVMTVIISIFKLLNYYSFTKTYPVNGLFLAIIALGNINVLI